MTKHASQPFNPDIAHVFFRAGEIEAWGRGIERIFAACREAGFPAPAIKYEETGLWISFPYAAVAAGQAHETVHLIDWADPEKNDFALAGRSRSRAAMNAGPTSSST